MPRLLLLVFTLLGGFGKYFWEIAERYGKQVGIISLGHTLRVSFDFAFDYLLYFSVIEWYGPLLGGGIMMVLSLLVCAFLLILYQRMRIDWLGVEAIAKISDILPAWLLHIRNRTREAHPLVAAAWAVLSVIAIPVLSLLHWLTRQGNWGVFLVLSIHSDPFVTTAYFKNRKDPFGMLRLREWIFFLGSGVVSNVYWTARTFGILEGAKWLWKIFFS